MDTTYSRLPYPTSAELEWLFASGVPVDAMAEPWPIKSAKVRFSNSGSFDFDREGHQAIIFLAEDLGKAIDLIAWRPPSGGIASWRGAAFCLGDTEHIFSPATYFADGALRIHQTPLDWLKAERDGVVIVQTQWTYAYLRDARLSFADRAFAQKVKRWREPPAPRGELFIEVPAERAGA
jgi:hypothetical protein